MTLPNGSSMTSISALVRDSDALLDPATVKPAVPSDANALASFHSVGGRLLRAAVRHGRREAAAAAAEVFREAIETVPGDPSLHNGLGASLLALARFESRADALRALDGAAQAFQIALQRADDQAAPRAVRLRYAINLANVQWLQGERTRDEALIKRAADSLRSVAVGLSPSSPYWAHVQDNLGNAFAALGSTTEAIVAFDAALGGRQTASDRARSLSNLGTAHAERRRYDRACRCYREALPLLSRDQSPLLWGAIQHNLATALLQAALSSKQPEREVGKLRASVAAFRSALEIRQRERTPFDWAITAVNMAGALLSLGTHLVASTLASRRQPGLGHVREAIGLFREALDQLADADRKKTASNLLVALQVLARLSPDDATQEEIRQHHGDLLSFATRQGLSTIANEIRRITPVSTRAPPTLPAGLQWPAESYAQAHKERGENIVQFLSRVWLPLIQAGAVDLRTLRARDPSAAKAVDNYQQRRDPATGLRCRLPAELDIPTKREVNDRLAAGIAQVGDRPARLDWALRSRARRQRAKEKV
jgi:tetratricopeptide (TPR) repeat protein